MKIIVFIILCLGCISGCSENSTAPEAPYTTIQELNGLIDSLGGDCSGVIIRTRSLGILNLNEFTNLNIEFNNSTDADLASVQIFYIEDGESKFLVNINGSQISETKLINISSPMINNEMFLRVTLKSSVCTGHIYHLTVRDLKIKGR